MIKDSAEAASASFDDGLASVCAIAGYYQIRAEPEHLRRELSLGSRLASADELVLAARLTGLKARVIRGLDESRIRTAPTPAIVSLRNGGFAVFVTAVGGQTFRLYDPARRTTRDLPLEEFLATIGSEIVLVQRRFRGAGHDPATFGFRWFLPSIWRYREPLSQVLLASLFIQIFAIATPLLFQVIMDKVLVHRTYSTLFVIIFALAGLTVFDAVLQYLRSYALSHTTNRIDVELGRRLFAHLLALPLSYFETRPAGQTVARVRELETIRSFLTGQAMFSGLDLAFAVISIAILFVYSIPLALIVVATIPIYMLITIVLRPSLRERVQEKFNRGAEAQQFLVEAVVGVQTLKAAAVEPSVRMQWEERLAAYVHTGFQATMLAAGGQSAIQFVSKISGVAILLFGAKAAIDGDLTIGQLVAFNMIAGQVTQPVMRLSQLWQDFQQVQVSVERLGDILNSAPEHIPGVAARPPKLRGAIEMRNVTFAYQPNGAPVLRNISLKIAAGEVIGIVGPSGSGKSSLTKLVQRLYLPNEGQILVDGIDIAHTDPAWLRAGIGVVLQENILFNRSLHDNIALTNPAMTRAAVIRAAKLAGADEFILRLPKGYDTIIEERGANLSGGQRQRIAIARALASDPPVLIFDEATSALDFESERIIRANMRQIVRGRTVIMIAHRLSTVKNCDRIIGIVDGRIVESGTHAELMRQPKGLYAHLWNLQFDDEPGVKP